MPVVEESVVIARPPQEVFDFVSKFQNVAVFDSSVTASEQVGDGPLGVGTRGRGTSKVMGRQFDWTVEVSEFDPPRRVVSRSVEGKLDFTITFTPGPHRPRQPRNPGRVAGGAPANLRSRITPSIAPKTPFSGL